MTRAKEPIFIRANLSPEEMRRAIPKLLFRIDDLKAADITSPVESKRSALQALAQKVNTTIANVYPPDTHEYKRLFADYSGSFEGWAARSVRRGGGFRGAKGCEKLCDSVRG